MSKQKHVSFELMSRLMINGTFVPSDIMSTDGDILYAPMTVSADMINGVDYETIVTMIADSLSSAIKKALLDLDPQRMIVWARYMHQNGELMLADAAAAAGYDFKQPPYVWGNEWLYVHPDDIPALEEFISHRDIFSIPFALIDTEQNGQREFYVHSDWLRDSQADAERVGQIFRGRNDVTPEEVVAALNERNSDE